jgi:hypothetical protein
MELVIRRQVVVAFHIPRRSAPAGELIFFPNSHFLIMVFELYSEHPGSKIHDGQSCFFLSACGVGSMYLTWQSDALQCQLLISCLVSSSQEAKLQPANNRQLNASDHKTIYNEDANG